MAFMKKDMEPILRKYAGFGYTIYYLYQQHKVDKEEIQNIFRKLNPDIASLYLEKVLRKMELGDMEDAFSIYQQEYSKEDCLSDYFGIESDKITVRSDVYETALNYRYTDRMLRELKQESGVTERRIISSYQMLLEGMVEETKQSVVKTLDKKELSKAR